ncbi:restriction endonuclease subunit S [Empedobacter sp. GD03861]|uniref:restriction endonuclease subunit S n=1 Tax=Empedobacter sp. GD03861 TaxID=2975390 RepID=UPI00244A1744|nr:restriction endonuclease subunit S [Empedobacter sp. GD03861]MDH0675147.1 restriction endonuclease subunit S [Empedobacter sp. GD03861]
MIKVKIKDIVDIFNGSTPSTSVSENFDGHISWITPKDISDQKTKYINRGERNITEKGLNSIGGNLLPKGTILFSSRAPIGLMSICTKETATNQGFKNMVCKKDKIDNEYLFYLLKTQISKIQELGTGTTFKEVSKSTIESFEIYIEENVPTQQKIASVLSALDDKIEVNNKINAELEAMAKTLYDYWFVQFDFPNEDNKPYKSSGGKMVLNETLKREIPEGWEVKRLEDIVEVKDGTHDSPKYITENGYPLVTSKNLKKSGIDFSETNKITKIDFDLINQRSKVDTGDILFSMIGNIGTIYKVEEEIVNFAIKNVALFKTSTKQSFKNYLYQYLHEYDMQRYIPNVISGSIQKFIALGSLRNSPILYHEPTIKKYTELSSSIYYRITLTQKQNQELVQLRDWLLPMLMNGQVTVGDVADEFLGMVAEPSVDYKIKDDIKENRFALWLSNQKLAARGDIDEVVLREIFDAMDDEDQ